MLTPDASITVNLQEYQTGLSTTPAKFWADSELMLSSVAGGSMEIPVIAGAEWTVSADVLPGGYFAIRENMTGNYTGDSYALTPLIGEVNPVNYCRLPGNSPA